MDPTQATPLQKRVRAIPGGPYLLRTEVATLLDVSVRQLKRWAENYPEHCAPSRLHEHGGQSAWLYTTDDIGRLENFLRANHLHPPGRPGKWTAEQRVRRAGIWNLQHYHRRQLKRRTDAGDTEGAASSQARLDELRAELEAMSPRVE